MTRPMTDAQRQQCIALRERGFTYARIAGIVGFSDVAIRNVVSASKRPADVPSPKMLGLSDMDATLGEIAKELGISRTAVRKHEQNALRKLRRLMDDEGMSFDDFFGGER